MVTLMTLVGILCRFFTKKFAVLCKENDAKKAKRNISLKSLFLGHFGSKIPIFRTFFIDISFKNSGLQNFETFFSDYHK